jgi:TRAP-type uncharacterized transport system fused permease subunit
MVFGFTAVGLLLLAVANAGYLRGELSGWIRIALLPIALLLFLPALVFNIGGLVLTAGFIFWRYTGKKTLPSSSS